MAVLGSFCQFSAFFSRKTMSQSLFVIKAAPTIKQLYLCTYRRALATAYKHWFSGSSHPRFPYNIPIGYKIFLMSLKHSKRYICVYTKISRNKAFQNLHIFCMQIYLLVTLLLFKYRIM
jgi:hypothetical protein